jgi:hypothetical protein
VAKSARGRSRMLIVKSTRLGHDQALGAQARETSTAYRSRSSRTM